MLYCKKLRRCSGRGKGGSAAYIHPEAVSGRREGLFVSATRGVSSFDTEGNEYTAYVLRCSYVADGERVSWEVKRRYNDFFTLHTKLKRYGAVVAELPSRNPFGMMSSVVRSREIGLQEYLQSVLNHCNDKQCTYLAKFLQVQKNLPSYQERAQTSETGALQSVKETGHVSNHGATQTERGRSAAASGALSLPLAVLQRGLD